MPGPAGFIKGVGFSGENWTGEPAAFVLTGFCNLRCPFCFAGDLVLRAAETPSLPEAEALERLAALREKTGLLIISGGEPTLFRGLADFLADAKVLGFSTVLETNGTQPGILAHLLDKGLADRVGLDIKARLDDESYSRACGVDVPASLLRESIAALRGHADRVVIRTTAAPGLIAPEDADALGPELTGFRQWIIQDLAPGRMLDPGFLRSRAPGDGAALQDRAARHLPAVRFRPEAYRA